MFKSLQKYMKPVKSKGKKKAKQEWPFTKTDVADGLLGLVNCKLAAPKFSNQPKDRLVDERVHGPMVEELVPAWEKFWKANKDFALKIIERATLLNDRTTDFRKDKTLIKNVKSSARRVATKLAAITSSKTPVEKRELLIVEGDSAGGGLKRARDKTFQAVYPLRGKPMNVLTAKKEKINDNAEITGLLSALGVNGKDAKPTLYGKVILFADSDVDGAHIDVLMSGAFYKFLPHLIQNGNLYVVKAPRYKARHRDKVIFAQTKEEVYKKAGTENVDISHLKGWGEVNEEDLWHVALDPATRKLYKLVAADKKDSKEFELLIGENTSYRKKLFGVS
jgi:DNA gyrase subunit B